MKQCKFRHFKIWTPGGTLWKLWAYNNGLGNPCFTSDYSSTHANLVRRHFLLKEKKLNFNNNLGRKRISTNHSIGRPSLLVIIQNGKGHVETALAAQTTLPPLSTNSELEAQALHHPHSSSGPDKRSHQSRSSVM